MHFSPRHRTLLRMLVLCLAYAVTGWLALQIAVPPGYAAPLFPPAGIALAAVMLYGPSCLPAIFLGSLLVQVPAAIQTGIDIQRWPGLLVPAFGAMLQARVGYGLARRLIGLPNTLDSQDSILNFVALVAPLGCVVSASIAVPTLVLMHAIPPSESTFTWINWWAGDTLGVLVMVPLTLVLFGLPAADWRPRRLTVAVPMSVALTLLAVTFMQVREWETQRLQTQFNRDAEFVASLVQKRFDAQLDQLQALERLTAVHPGLSADEWRDFVTPMMARNPGTQNFGWSPLVTDAQRDAFEARVRAAGRPDFRILGRNVAGQTFPAARKAEYLPILFVEPLAENRSVLGLDPLVLDRTASAVQRSRKSGLPIASESIRLVQETGEQRGIVVYQAVLAGSPPHMTGLVSAVFRMDDAMQAILGHRRTGELDVCLSEPRTGASERLYGPAGCEQAGWAGKRLNWETPLTFAGRTWLLRVGATSAYMNTVGNWGLWLMLALGLLSTGILGAFLLLTSGRTRRVESLVDERTRQLAAATDTLRRQQQELAQAQRIARLGSWETLPGSDELRCSDELMAMLTLDGSTPIRTRQLIERLHPDDRPRFLHALEQVDAMPHRIDLDCRLARDGTPMEILHFRLESEGHGPALRIRGTAQDVSSARAAEARIARLAHFDVLTGLPNRTQWNERAHSELRAAARHGDILAVLFLDLDHFKAVNDSLGHPVGDQLLSAVARRLSGCLRENDFLARLGGDEFVVLLPRLSHREDAALVARKLIAALEHPVVMGAHELTVSVSIGIALHPDDGSDVDTLLKHADLAMYRAKDQGRNAYHYFLPDMDVRAMERLLLETALRRAVERDELRLHYQPQLRTRDSRVTGCEALVRWQHPELGLLPPAQFIGVAETSGIIHALGAWVLEHACRQQVIWATAGRPLIMAVNISALQFRQADFYGTVKRILEDTGIDPAHLELELTESALMQLTPEVLERMHALRALGVNLALDDFGTGYSSLSHLKRLPIRRLKLDRSFVEALPADLEDAAIASATLSLAQDLGMEVVAEGVESPSQVDFLTRRGCPLLQGFLFSEPLPAAEFDAWLLAR